MPIYEYKCRDCKKEFEFIQRMSDDSKTKCEECAGSLERLISQSAFHLKGGGWYKDLYSSTKKESSTPSTDSNEVKTKSDSKTPSKSATDSAPKKSTIKKSANGDS